MDTISGTTHIKTIFSFWTGDVRNFIGNALCISNDSVTQLIHTVYFSIIISVVSNLRNKYPVYWNLENEGTRYWSPLFLFNRLPVQKSTTTTGEMGWFTM
jgi:hypothetical protein